MQLNLYTKVLHFRKKQKNKQETIHDLNVVIRVWKVFLPKIYRL